MLIALEGHLSQLFSNGHVFSSGKIIFFKRNKWCVRYLMWTSLMKIPSAIGGQWQRIRQGWTSSGDPDYLTKSQSPWKRLFRPWTKGNPIPEGPDHVGWVRYGGVVTIPLSTSWSIYLCQGQNADVNRGQTGNINERSGQVQVSRKFWGLWLAGELFSIKGAATVQLQPILAGTKGQCCHIIYFLK